jgi:hypothetical protein
LSAFRLPPLNCAAVHLSRSRHAVRTSVQTENATANAKLAANEDVTFDLAFKSSKRDGYRPWAASFAFNNANELPMPLDDRTNDVTAGLRAGQT